jgi:hypothetical protein
MIAPISGDRTLFGLELSTRCAISVALCRQQLSHMAPLMVFPAIEAPLALPSYTSNQAAAQPLRKASRAGSSCASVRD